MGGEMTRVGRNLRNFRALLYRIRAFWEFGLADAWKAYRKARRNKTEPKHTLAVCTVAKNEATYFAEWIEYHHLLGVEKFYVYDNESDDNTREVLRPYIDNGLVEYIFSPGGKIQRAVYADCLKRFRYDALWMAFIDLDEFIVPVRDKTIPEFLEGFACYSAVQINWVCYGSAGEKHARPGLVIERFRDHSPLDDAVNRHVKSIVRPARVLNFSGAHECVALYGKIVDANKNIVTKYHRMRPASGQDIIRLNHYAVKSYGEFLQKSAKNRVRSGKNRDNHYFERFDTNQIKDDPIMDKYIPAVKERLAMKSNGNN